MCYYLSNAASPSEVLLLELLQHLRRPDRDDHDDYQKQHEGSHS